MNSITSIIKRHPQVTFWGIAWITAFVAQYMNAKDPDHPWLFLLYGTFLGGILVTAIADGGKGLKTFFSRIVRWRAGIQWYAVALLLPFALRLVAFWMTNASAVTPANIHWPVWTDLFIIFLWPNFLGIALAEEPALRGFALTRLMNGRSALTASLILGALHSIWHLGLFITGQDSPMTILIIFAGAIINTWLFNHTNGSVLLTMLLHASVDLTADLFNPAFTGADATRQAILLVVLYVAVGILLPILAGKELGRKPEAVMDAIAAEQPMMAD